MRGIFWQSDAWESYVALQSQKSLLKKINELIKCIQRNGYDCPLGTAEMLKGNLAGYASVRIDKKNRIVFQVDDFQVTIIECGGHYGEH
ncbi:MAG: Txe/YoeB family addiction module toxin [Synergistaceae bacterium]|nr:Txe/YoeB family addiction module toxin [Synergistaceae bacterium]